ncbi:MAG TPA: protein kinase [Candidatus Acidoferrales bacterium]|nr:protein kinase [Candidatus Acidoferrales bacterium]
MSLTSGTKLGPYEIQSPIGAGGMGEVYRARDTRLGRDVAIKILPQHLASTPEVRQRFEREARAVSSLNHPHICTLHDVGHQDGTDFLVMEYLEGETLAKRLEKGALPTAELLRIAIEIADALEKAHRQGVIHRDLKPGNIMLTKGGAKLLDFGLAKAAMAPVTVDLSSSPTVSQKTGEPPTTPLTARGTIVGTFQYMAPEQLEGKDADARSDIFSFGAVLYEMATGKRAFEGKSQASLIAAILEREPPPISSLQPMSPPALDRVVKTCLAKEPEERFQSAHDLKLQLEWIRDAGSQAGEAAPVAARRKYRDATSAAIATLAIASAAIFGAMYFLHAPAEMRIIRAYIKPAPNSSITSYNGGSAGFAISPNGLRLAYVATAPDGKSILWVRSLDSLQAQPLADTEGALLPFWSPDSQFLGFFADGKLKKIEASGGPAITLCDAPGGRGGTWNRDGTIVFSPFFSTPLFRVPASGGAPTQATNLDSAKGESTHRWPFFLPDGRHFLFLAGNPLASAGSPTNSIMVGSLDSKETKFLFDAHSNAIYASGQILFLRENTLMAQPFDVKRLEFTGDAFPVAEQVGDVVPRVEGEFSGSDNGVLVYLGMETASRQLIWFDRSGKQIGAVPGSDTYSDPHISPDGKVLAFALNTPSSDIWLFDLARSLKSEFTFGTNSSTGNMSPIWSPDSRRIAYTSIRKGKFGIYERAADGSGQEETLVEPGPDQLYPLDWAPDGRSIAYLDWHTSGTVLWMLPLGGDRKPYPLNLLQQSQSFSFRTVARFSPDGRWIAYTSNDSGRFEVYVGPFPGPGGKWLVSTDGGWFPQWRRDGKELFYVSLDNEIMAAAVSANGSSFVVGTVQPLFQSRPYYGSFTANLFDVTPDGQRFIVPYDAGQPDRFFALIENWPALLKKQ